MRPIQSFIHLTKGLVTQIQCSAQEERILELLQNVTDGVREENLAQVPAWDGQPDGTL